MRERRAFCILAAIAALTATAATTAPPALAFLPYRTLLEAARSPEKPLSFVQDKVLRIDLRRALVEADPGDALSISPYVIGGHAYLVGWVSSADERDKLEAAAHGVTGLASFSSYLPLKPTGESAPSESDELALKAKVESAITLNSSAHRMNVSVDVLGTHAVLVGAVESSIAAQSAGQAARDTPGVSGITSFLTVPQPGNQKLLQGLLP